LCISHQFVLFGGAGRCPLALSIIERWSHHVHVIVVCGLGLLTCLWVVSKSHNNIKLLFHNIVSVLSPTTLWQSAPRIVL
jgi:hypothetical protein